MYSQSVHERLQEITNGTGPDVVIEAVGAPATYQTAINEVAFTGLPTRKGTGNIGSVGNRSGESIPNTNRILGYEL